MNNKTKKKSPILTILLVIASIVFFFMLITFIIVFLDNDYSAEHDTDYLYYYVEKGDYSQLYEACCQNRAYNVKADADMLEAYAIADYYHASFMYYAYKDADPAIAGKYLDAMKEHASKVDEMSFVLEDIDAQFEAYQ